MLISTDSVFFLGIQPDNQYDDAQMRTIRGLEIYGKKSLFFKGLTSQLKIHTCYEIDTRLQALPFLLCNESMQDDSQHENN